jgi:opacity protein-like surface antigen
MPLTSSVFISNCTLHSRNVLICDFAASTAISISGGVRGIMNKNRKVLASLMVAFLYASVAQADDRNRNANFLLTLDRVFIKENGFEDEMTSLKFGTGYRFSDYAGFELFYIYYGEISERDNLGNSSSLTASALVLNGIAVFPVNPLLDFYAKIGISSWDAELELAGIATASEEGTDPVYTLGAGYNIDHDSTIRFEYELSDYEGTEFGVISAGFQHNF